MVTKCKISADIRAGVVVVPKGLWLKHSMSNSTSNAMVPDHYTDLGAGPCYNDARVEIEKIASGYE